MAALAKALRTEVMADMDLRGLAQVLRSKGRGRDTVLAHITPREADMLKRMGGRGSTNPETGLPEYEDDLGMAGVDFGPPQPGGYEDTGAGAAPQAQPYTPPDAPFGEFDPTIVGSGISQDFYRDEFPPQFPAQDQAPQTQAAPITDVRQVTAPPGALAVQRPEEAYGPPQPPGAAAAAAAPGAAPPKETGFLANMQRALSDPATLARLGLGIGGTALGQLAAQRAQAQATRTMGADRATISAAQQQLRDLGAQYQQIGQEQIGAARRGELTPMSAQAYQAAQAQLAQQTARMGGVGQMQATGSLERLRQQLLSNQMSSGLSISNIGDQYVRQAIQSGLQGNLAVNQAQRQYAQQIAQMQGQLYRGLGGVLGGTPSVQSPTTV